MFDVIETYARHSGDDIWEELLKAWDSFDQDDYFSRVICRSGRKIGDVSVDSLDHDGFTLLRVLARKQLASSTLEHVLKTFIADRTLNLKQIQVESTSKTLGLWHSSLMAIGKLRGEVFGMSLGSAYAT